MSSIAIHKNIIAATNGLLVDIFKESVHTEIAVTSKAEETDAISDVELSTDGKYLALITSVSKQLLVYEQPFTEAFRSFVLPRSASKIRFTANNEEILVADKSGDVLLYKIADENSGTKLLGHLSLLLDVLQTNDEKFIISSDRDEKIRVTCYPNTYCIQTYCLGHKEFVNHIELLPHNLQYLMSSSGDGFIKCWDYSKGHLCHSIDTFLDVDDNEIKEKFTKAMDEEGIEVGTLPIVHFGMTQLDETSSLLAVMVHNFNKVLLYILKSGDNNAFSHNLCQKLELDRFPSSMKCDNSSLYIYNNDESQVSVYKIFSEDGCVSIKLNKSIKMFQNVVNVSKKENNFEAIKVLFKRKFDNVQEYQERKKQRIEKSGTCL